jgi:hypothetical protein
MASFLGFRGKGIWCSDGSFRTWCALLAETLPLASEAPWCLEYAAHLRQEAQSPHRGYLQFRLYETVNVDDTKRDVVAEAAKLAMIELVKNAELPLERLRELPVAEGVSWLRPLDTNEMLRLASAFLLLLDGLWPDDEFTSPQF